MGFTISFIGLGTMGGPMVRRLSYAGHTLRLYDIRPGIAAALANETSGFAASTLADAAAGQSLAILMLPNSSSVHEVCLAPGGLADSLARGSKIVDMSSSDPSATRELGKTLASREIALLDAPVSGGLRKAIDGTLAIMLGGDDEAACAEVAPTLTAMGTVFRTGRLGSGHAIKALNNYLSAAGLAASCEAVIIGKAFGLDPATMMDVINASTGRNNSTENKIKPFVLSGEFRKAGFALDLMVKDIRTTAELAQRLGLSLDGPAAARKFWEAAASRLGPGADHTEIFRYIEMVGDTRGDNALAAKASSV